MKQPESPDPITADGIKKALRTDCLGQWVYYLPSTASTNTMAHELAREGANEGALVITDYQTQGRGRLQREWISAPGQDLLFSLILRPYLNAARAFQVTAAASLAVAHAIRNTTGLHAAIKWPNDIYIRGKKTAGILTELSVCGDHVTSVVAGIGINVNSDPSAHPDLRTIATSLRLEAQQHVPRLPLLAAILELLERFYRMLKSGQFQELKSRWDALSLITGRRISITTGTTMHEGIAESVDDDGTLIMLGQNGATSRFVCGDVSLALER